MCLSLLFPINSLVSISGSARLKMCYNVALFNTGLTPFTNVPKCLSIGVYVVCQNGSFVYTAISRKVVAKNVHATIPKGNMGYGQYTVPDLLSCRTYFCCFPLALTNILPRPLVPFF